MPTLRVTHVSEQVLPISPVYTQGEGWGEGVVQCDKLMFTPLPDLLP
jgi:hypothetical protein